MVSILNCCCQVDHFSHLGSWFEKLSINNCCQVDHFSHFGSRFKVASTLQIWQRRRFTPRAPSSDQRVLGLDEQGNSTTAKPCRMRADNTGAEDTHTGNARTRTHPRTNARAHTGARVHARARMRTRQCAPARACPRSVCVACARRSVCARACAARRFMCVRPCARIAARDGAKN